ncbi:hypothetical protein [Halomarina oriensis]|uniref:Uncharacterized protein n=1 Tax=Halomarina oriensis TaxID=671145 RepID=A0A6B0GQV1_9EURY|nr:hypothetical protein [Halomarina oriensis]MWG35747.1 hypothetical protein [Halomarina oriensis]
MSDTAEDDGRLPPLVDVRDTLDDIEREADDGDDSGGRNEDGDRSARENAGED